MSFDELHNITKDTSGGSGGAGVTPPKEPTVPGISNALSNLGNDKNKGIVIPIAFGPMPPFPNLPIPPAVQVPIMAQDQTRPDVDAAESNLNELIHYPSTVPLVATDLTRPSTETAEGNISELMHYPNTVTLGALDQTQPATNTAESNLSELMHYPTTVTLQAHDGISSVIDSIGDKLTLLAQKTGSVFSNLGNNLSDWASNHQDLLGAIGTGIVVGGATLATGGLDLIPGGIAGISAALGMGVEDGAFAGIGAMADGGIVSAPQVKLIGEAGPEAVIPLSKIDSVLGNRQNTSSSGNSCGAGQPLNIHVTSTINGKAVAKTMHSFNLEETDRQGLCIGYPSSYNYPR